MTDVAEARAVTEVPPRLAEGVQLIGDYEGSGYKEPPSLVRRGDGQVIQLTRLLYLVARHCDGQSDYASIAERVSDEYGRGVSAGNVQTLVEDKLRPLGVLAAADGSSPSVEKPDPLLALKFRKAIIPAHRSQAVASLFKPLFLPPVVLAALVGLAAFDAWLFFHHGIAQGFRDALYDPALILLVFALVVLSAGWHEFGHAAGCAYGGGCPGAMGAGIYIAYPAFYTDVTDSYRLSRGARLRTDLAGVYFNALFVLATAGAYFLTGWEPLLLVILVQHIEMAHQLLPFLRLDGYYVVADLTGVPDLFNRIKPILTSVIPGRKPDERVTVLKPWVRRVVTLWVMAVVPLLAFQVGLLLLHAPRIFGTAWDSLSLQWDKVAEAAGRSDILSIAVGIIQVVILVVPLVGIVFTFFRLGRRLVVSGWRRTDGHPAGRGALVAATTVAAAGLLYVWLPNGDYAPIRGGERGTLQEAVASVREVPTGRPGLVSRERAAQRGDLGATDAPEDPSPDETDNPVIADAEPEEELEEPAATTTTTALRTTTTRARGVTTTAVTSGADDRVPGESSDTTVP